MTDTKRRFNVEQDDKWVSEQHHNGKWAATKRVQLSTWTVYEYVGSPSYQTPIYFAKNETEAREYVESLS